MALNLLSCISGQKKEKLNLKWQPGFNAPKYYPAMLVSGSFNAHDKRGEFISSGLCTGGRQNNGWGEGGLEIGEGDFVPEELSLAWFSFAEDKFYKGTFKLPTDTMYALFKQGFISAKTGKNFRYNYLRVNPYPMGGVAVWMKVGGTRTVEIGHFQGEEMEYDFKCMFPSMTINHTAFAKEVMDSLEGAPKYLAQHGISQEPFKTLYRQRYNYTIAIDNVSHLETEFILFECYNGEMDKMEGEGLENNFFKTKAVPKSVYFRWREDMVVYFGDIIFNEEEIFKAFTTISSECGKEPFVLYLKPDFSTGKLGVCLRGYNEETGDPVEIQIEKAGRIGKSSMQPYL